MNQAHLQYNPWEKIRMIHKDSSLRLREMKISNINNPALAYINVNSIRNKHADLFSIVNLNVNILTFDETKFDSSFPTAQFTVDGYGEPDRKDRNANGGGYWFT